ncbi:hypothetical protein ABTM90_19970, partial [Acinetobacter baumannii]
VMGFKRTRYIGLLIDEILIQIPSDTETGTVLAEGIRAHIDLSTLVEDEARHYLARIESLRLWLPDLQLPHFGDNPWQEFLLDWCAG